MKTTMITTRGQPATLSAARRTSAITRPLHGGRPALVRLIRAWWILALLLPTVAAHGVVVFTTLHSFQIFTNGAAPTAGLVQGPDGNFYGTTSGGGTNGWGTVFKISTNGTLITLYSFTGGDDGADPYVGLTRGSDDNFYGTTSGGGTSNQGTVFKISTNGTPTSLYSFTGGNDGSNPDGGLIQGSDGYLYGTTDYGGANDEGTVFKISVNGALTTLHSFTGTNDGALPEARLIQASDGYFYGTTYIGGASNWGTIFRINTNGGLTSLYSFTGGDDGAAPAAELVQGSDGYLYGTTVGGGKYQFGYSGYGTVFKISTNGALTNLYSFTGGNDGSSPGGGLIQGGDGYLYGTTGYGGTNDDGTLFKFSTNGTLSTLYAFTGTNDGANPNAALAEGSDGNLYGTTVGGGADGAGTVFMATTGGELTRLYSFIGDHDGANPSCVLSEGSDDNFYGTTSSGGASSYGYSGNGNSQSGYGTVFKISSTGTLTCLYSFTGGDDGEFPYAGLVQGSDGYFYGTTSGYQNGPPWGTVFQIDPSGLLFTLYSFSGGNDGANPYAGLVEGGDGYFYGTTAAGGTNNVGTVFRIGPIGPLSTLYSFTGGNDGAYPLAGLVQDSDGNLYGTTQSGGTNDSGTVFKVSINGALTTLYTFTGGNDGGGPYFGLVWGSDGYLYGTTDSGGTNDLGTVFKISPAGMLSTLYSFNGDDGGYPNGLVPGTDGNFYGTTATGGTNGEGTIFKISINGVLTTLYSFTGGEDGGRPNAGLVEGSDGGFYGTTSTGGRGQVGTVFRLALEPVFLAVTQTNDTLNFTWSTDKGWKYQLQYTSDLNSHNWANIGPQVTAPGTTLSATDSKANGPRRFYRVMLSP
jgi:uncharacterized repeat protein (TIGR03803 family)